MYNNHKTQEKNQHLNISDLDFYSEGYELTDDDLNNINGGAFGAAGGAIGSLSADYANGKPLSWRSAYAWALGGATAGYLGGLKGAGLAGED